MISHRSGKWTRHDIEKLSRILEQIVERGEIAKAHALIRYAEETTEIDPPQLAHLRSLLGGREQSA